MRQRVRIWSGAFLALTCLGLPASAQPGGGKYSELLKRIPDQANVLLLIDMDGLYQSKLGQSEHWREKIITRAAGGLGLADDAAKVVVAASYDLNTLAENWKIGMAEARGPLPSLERLAAHEGGFVEKIRNIPVAWTPRGFYLITFPPQIFGFVEQADRRAMWKWIDSTLTKPRTFPPGFADRAFYRANAGFQIVLAMNLAESVSPKLVAPWLKAMPNVAKARLDPEIVANRLATVQSASLQVDVAETMTGAVRVEFTPPDRYGPPVLTDAQPILKEVIIRLLEDYGAMLPELESWTLQVAKDQQSVELTGRVGVESARRVLSLAHPPSLTVASERSASETPSKDAPEKPPAEPSRDAVIKASQHYYRAVVDLLNGLKHKDRPTYSSYKLWYDRYAKQIEELPILGIDTDLLDWGNVVARTLREMSSGINFSAKDQGYRSAQSPNGAYVGYGGYAVGGSKGYDQAIIKRQSDAVLSVQLDGKWQALELSIADTRRKMVEKYKVDF